LSAFSGFERADGRVGTRNHLLILSVTGLTTPTARHVAGRIRPAIAIGTPYGSNQLGDDAKILASCLAAFACHPNVGATVVIGADQMKIEPVVRVAEAAKKPVTGLCLDDFGHDALRLTDRAIRAGAALLKDISRQQQRSLPLSFLSLGLECGRSDPSSGLIANPLVGLVADRIVDAGGTAMIGETIEWLGAEDRLAARAATPELAQAIHDAVQRRERCAVDAGIDLAYNNPSLTNIEGGLTTIEEKSLGAIAKSGSSTIRGLIGYGKAPDGPGLWVMDAPAYAPESLTGFTAAGCNLALFTTGVGNSYTSSLMPTIKLTANPDTATRLETQLDFDASRAFLGEERLDAATDRFMQQLIATASGELTFGEILGDADEVISRFGANL
jgi:altronate dehydratase large subunit